MRSESSFWGCCKDVDRAHQAALQRLNSKRGCPRGTHRARSDAHLYGVGAREEQLLRHSCVTTLPAMMM